MRRLHWVPAFAGANGQIRVPTDTNMTTLAPSAPATALIPRPRSAVMEFCRQQPLGAMSFVIIVAMMFGGIFSNLVAPYDPLDIDFEAPS